MQSVDIFVAAYLVALMAVLAAGAILAKIKSDGRGNQNDRK